MKNRTKDRISEEVAIQLRRSEVKKKKLYRDICKEYEFYLQIIRKCLFNSAEKGIFRLYSESLNREESISLEYLTNFLKNNIGLLINAQLPFLTVEQLKIANLNVNQKKLSSLYSLKELLVLEETQNVDFEFENNMNVDENFKSFWDNNANNYGYYDSLNVDKFTSVNLDEKEYLFSFNKNKKNFKNSIKKQIFVSVPELIEKTNNEHFSIIPKIDDQESLIGKNSHDLKIFDYIDKSLNNLLLDLSYKVNQELLEINLIEKIISKETFQFLVNQSFIIKHSGPFIIKFDLSFNDFQLEKIKSLDIDLFNINNSELEFFNLELSILRNKINELKHQFKLLDKKSKYWKKKSSYSII